MGRVIRKNKQHSKMIKYVYIRSVKELLKHIPLVVFKKTKLKL